MVGTIVYGTDMIRLEVVPSPLESVIEGGVYRRVKHTDIVTLDGSLSYDPDSYTDSGSPTNFRYNSKFIETLIVCLCAENIGCLISVLLSIFLCLYCKK